MKLPLQLQNSLGVTEPPFGMKVSTRGRWRRWSRPRNVAFFCAAMLLLHPALTGAQDMQQQRRNAKDSFGRRRAISYKVNYYSNPQLLWKYQLDEHTIETANAVEPNPFNENIIYVTTREGSLVGLAANDGGVIAMIEPKRTSFINEDEETGEWTTTCQSGMAFGVMEDGSQFLVYSVIDQPPEGSDYSAMTRVIAVSIPEHELLWSSRSLLGESMGSPVIYQTRNQQTYVVLTHNSEEMQANQTTTKTGHFSLLRAYNGQVVWTEAEWGRDTLPMGYGPPGLAPSPLSGKYHGGEQNQNDFVAWANSEQDGMRSSGYTYAFQLPENYLGTENDISNLASVVLKKVRWTSLSRPVFDEDGSSMYIAGDGNQVRGWTGNTYFDNAADWTLDLSIGVDGTENLSAIPVAPTLSNDGQRLFVATTPTAVHCVNAQTGEKLWSIPGASEFLSGVRVSPDDQRVYFIQSIDGRLYAYDQHHGVQQWLTSCDAFEEDCSNSVRATFALSRTGQYLYYADVLGTVIALTLGDLKELDLDAPQSPGIFDNSGGAFPTSSHTSPETDVKSGPSVGGSVALIIIVFMIAIGSGVYVIILKKEKTRVRKKTSSQRRRAKPEWQDEDSDDVASSGPDPYEDSMISKHQLKCIEPKKVSSEELINSDGAYPEGSTPSTPSDRPPMLLGTSNRVAPLTEDFSLGAAVLV